MTGTEQDTPVAILTVDQNYHLTSSRLEARLAWLRSQGIKPGDAFRTEIYRTAPPGDGYYARVSAFERNADGHRYCVLNHDHGDPTRSACEAAQRTYDVELSALPPEAR